MDERRPSRTSRRSRLEKRKKTNKIIGSLLIVGILLFLGLFWYLLADAPEEQEQETEEAVESEEDELLESNQAEDEDDEIEVTTIAPADESSDVTEDEQEPIVTNQVEPSDDNVIEAFEGNWPPIMTEQSEPDILNFDRDSQNRQEMELAIQSAIDITDPIIWWLSNAGHQQVIATVSDREETTIYRVYLRWVDHKGWQAFKRESLKENDQKWRFE